MPTQIEEQAEEVLRTLRAQADARNMGLADYLRLLADAGHLPTADAAPDLKEFELLLDQLSEGLSSLPVLPREFGRADIYAGHD